MKRFSSFLSSAAAGVLALVSAASAQTPANITVFSGNGQVICPTCTLVSPFTATVFDPMEVKVTDANGNPVPNVSVNWGLTSGPGVLSDNQSTDTTSTNQQGIASEAYFPGSPNTGTVVNPYNQGVITASISAGVSVSFYETQALVNVTNQSNSPSAVQVSVQTPSTFPPCPNCPSFGDTLGGPAGGTATDLSASSTTTQFKIQVYTQGTTTPAVPNVSLRLISNQGSPTISCATEAGADPGSVLTDSTGTAVCTPVLGASSGSGSFCIVVGGNSEDSCPALPVNPNQTPIYGFFGSGNFGLQVTPGSANALMIVSGNNQTGTPGQALAVPLVATVVDGAGNPLAGQNVTWTVSPSNSATLANATGTSDASGHVQNTVTLASTAGGQITVKLALASNPSVSTTFTINASVQLTGLQIVSGNNQTAIINTAFATPLTVQLNAASGQATSGITVSFAVTGPATLSNASATTNSSGQATVTAIAGSTTGPVTVTATAGSQTAVFTLTVLPQGPSLTASSFYNGADFQPGSISPCGIATIVGSGLAAAIQGVVVYNGVGALPYTLGSDSVTFGGAQAPIFNVANQNGQQQITVQVPCSVTPGNVAVVVNVGSGSSMVTVPVKPASPGLFMTTFTATAGSSAIPVLERPDGSFVSPTNPAHPGETLIAYVTGLGPTAPAVATNSLPAPGSNPAIQGTVIVGMNGQGVELMGTSVSPDLVGVETVSFVVPSTTPAGNSTFSVGVLYPSSGSTVYYSNVGMFPVQ